MKSTKELAKELGVLKKKQKCEKKTEGTEGPLQTFSYLIILDFESTCWQNEKFRSQEIIEFPAVLLNTRTGLVESEYHCYVQPQEHPTLSEFCTELTGITQNQVDEGIPLFICLKRFSAWLNQQSKSKNFTFLPNITLSSACFVTWSDWDLSVCLHYECKRKQLRRPPEMNYWIDLRATYRKFYNRRPQGLKGALQEVGILFQGREHSGLHDSRNTASLVTRMILDGCQLQLTKSINANDNVANINNQLWKTVCIGRSSASHGTNEVNANECKDLDNKKINSLNNSLSCDANIKEKELEIAWFDDEFEDVWLDDEVDDSEMLLCASLLESELSCEQLPEHQECSGLSDSIKMDALSSTVRDQGGMSVLHQTNSPNSSSFKR